VLRTVPLRPIQCQIQLQHLTLEVLSTGCTCKLLLIVRGDNTNILVALIHIRRRVLRRVHVAHTRNFVEPVRRVHQILIGAPRTASNRSIAWLLLATIISASAFASPCEAAPVNVPSGIVTFWFPTS
jgi:hypothetical protein